MHSQLQVCTRLSTVVYYQNVHTMGILPVGVNNLLKKFRGVNFRGIYHKGITHMLTGNVCEFKR